MASLAYSFVEFYPCTIKQCTSLVIKKRNLNKICEPANCFRIPGGTSPELTSLLMGLLRRNSSERMPFDMFFTHPFLQPPAPPTDPPSPPESDPGLNSQLASHISKSWVVWSKGANCLLTSLICKMFLLCFPWC